jgi:hypothetical protein
VSKRTPQTGDVVEVEWGDSERINLGWEPVKKYRRAAHHPSGYRTAGYWLGGDQGRVVVGLSVDPANGNVTEAMSIPAVAVTRVQVLGRANKRVREALG